MVIKNILFSSGYITLVREGGADTKYPIESVLRALDIPDLNIGSLTLLTTLSQLLIILIQTLIENEVITEEFAGDFDWQYMRETLVDTLNAEEVY